MNYKERYELWLNEKAFDDEFISELKAIPKEDLEEFFYKELEFGTAGLRGINGAGSNRMNKYVIRRASQGYAMYLCEKSNKPSCAIAYDNRRFSKYFAKEAASVLAANGVKTYLFEELRPTPELSFAVIEYKCTGGIVCTASHNPPEYSGYKVYGSDGCQLNTEDASKVSNYILGQNGFSDIKQIDFEEGLKDGLIEWINNDYDDEFVNAVSKQILHPETLNIDCKSVYTPLHGTGYIPMKKLMDKLGVKDMEYLEVQCKPDSEFTTSPVPNPEEEIAFDLSKEYGKKIGAELLCASDPDADRFGCMLLDKDGEYRKINGNQIGALLAYYLFSEKKDMPKNACLVKTIVTSDLTEYIAKDFGIQTRETLTGFKNICGIIREFEKTGEAEFVMGFEESYGYLVGTHCRDKDSFVATMFMLDMVKYYKSKDKSLFDILDEIYAKYGYFKDDLVSIKKPGKSGMEEIANMMVDFRSNYKDKFMDFGLKEVLDYQSLECLNLENGEKSKINEEQTNALKFRFNDDSWLAIRPSGTEPKIKFYFCIRGENEADADKKHKELKAMV